MNGNVKMTVIMSLIMVLGSTGVSVVSEAPSAFDDSEMIDNDVMVIGGLYDLAPKSRLRPSATQAKNARRGFQILDSLGLCFGRDQDANLVLMPKPAQTRSGWAFWAAVGAVVALGAINPAFGLAGAVGAILEAPKATEATTKEHDPTEGPSAEDMEAMKVQHAARPEWLKAIKDKALDQMWETFGPMLGGVLPRWQKPWKTVRNGIEYNVVNPVNALTGNRYNGANVFTLSGAFLPVWATTKQINKLAKALKIELVWDEDYQTDWKENPGSYMIEVNGEMRPLIKDLEDQNGSGQRAIWVPMKKTIWVEEKKNGVVVIGPNGKPKKKRISVVQKGLGGMTIGKEALVWNIEDTNLPIDAVLDRIKFEDSQPAPPVEEDIPVIEGAKALVDLVTGNLTGLRYKEAPNRAFYSPGEDYISMPPAGTFKESDVSILAAFAATLAHEGAHATGHRLRFARPLQNRFGDKKYAKEELIAELAAMIILRAWGFDDVPAQHAAYLKSWATKVVGKPDPENPDAWMDSCRSVLSKSAQAAEWVLTGMPEWFEGAKTTEGQQIKDEEPMPANAASMALEDLPSGYLYRATPDEDETAPLVREIGGGSNAPSTDREAVYASMGPVSTTTTGDVHYGPFSPADSVRHNGVIHHAEEFVSMVIPGDDFDANILCLGTGEVLAVMKVGEGHHRIGWDENGGVYVTYPEMGWVSIPAPQRAIGAFGFIPALLDPSMASMVALGVAMVVGMTKITETEQKWLPWMEEEFLGVATHTIEDNARGYNDRKQIGKIWSAMVGCGERQIEDYGFGKDITIRNKGNERACIHRVVLRTGSKKEVVPSGNEVMVTREKATLTLFAKAREFVARPDSNGLLSGRNGHKTFEVGVVLTGYLREEYGEVKEDIVTTGFRIGVDTTDFDGSITVKEGFESQMLRRDYNKRDSGMKLDREFIAAIAESNEIIEDALTLMLGYGGRTHDSGDFSKGHIIQKESEAKNDGDRFSVYHDFTEPWEKYGASAVDDLAKECYEAYEKYKRANEWSEVTRESQKALDAILRYGSLPAEEGDSDAAWNRVSADALGTLAVDLELADSTWNGIHMKREISKVIEGGDWKTRLAFIEHKGNHSWNAPIKKSGLITLIQTFLRRDALVSQREEEFWDAVRAYTDGCIENEVCWTEAMLNKPLFKEIESDLTSLLNHEQSEALMSIWAHSHCYEHEDNEPICQVNIPCKDESEIVTFRQNTSIYQERPFDCEEIEDGRHISQALGMMEAGLERVGLLSEDDQQVMGDFKSLKNAIARLEKGLAAFEEFRYTCRHLFNHNDDGIDLWLDHGAIAGVVQAKVERRFPHIMNDGLDEDVAGHLTDEEEAEAMGAVGAFALLPALLDPSLTTLVALGVAMIVGMAVAPCDECGTEVNLPDDADPDLGATCYGCFKEADYRRLSDFRDKVLAAWATGDKRGVTYLLYDEGYLGVNKDVPLGQYFLKEEYHRNAIPWLIDEDDPEQNEWIEDSPIFNGGVRAIGAFGFIPALLDPSMASLVALGACVALSMVKAEEATPMRPNDSIKTLWARKYRSAIPWLSWLSGLDDPVSINDLVVTKSARFPHGVPRDANFGRRLEHMNEKGLEYRAKYKEYESGVKARNQEALEARGRTLVFVAPDDFYDGLDQYRKGCYVQLQVGDCHIGQVEEIENRIRDLFSKEPWHRYVNALYDANLLDCEKVRYPEEDRYQDGWCECCKKPDMMDDPDNTVIRWWMRGAYTDRFVTLAKRIQRAFNSREIGFWYEVGEARPDDKGLYRCPVTVIHGPVTDSGWSALAIIEAFDPERIKHGTDALVSMVPTGMEKATYEATLEDGTKETVEYNKPVWEEETSIEVTGFLEGRFGSPMFQYDPTICDHCGKKAHNRKKLVVVKHEEEGHRIVGSSCLYEYTNIDPKTLENLFNLTENWNPFEGLATDPESWTKGINKRDLTDFLRPLGVVLASAGAYVRGSGSRAFGMVMGDDLMENTSLTHDVHRKEIDPRMAYSYYRRMPGSDDPTGWYPVTKGSMDWDLVEDVKNYIKDGIQTNVDMVANNENPGDFGRTLAIVGRAGYVTAFSKGGNKATVNVVAGSASRFFRARKEKMEAEAKGDKATKAFPIEPSEMLKKWEGSIKATVSEVKYIEKYEAHVNTLLTDDGYSITVWSSNKKIIENLFGEVEIYRFVPTRINTFKGDESLQVKTIGVREVKA